ncbi:MAG: CRISPR-associated DxTHG motif protein [Sulfolobales archaeon]|nr:CRISPR-associated DxTHG motif protein [Sulfolobales archaeon]
MILDLSHGINYMPLLTREAIVEASKIYTILYDTELGLITLNSDPIPSERAGVEPKVFRSRLNVIDYKYFKRKDSIDDAYSMLNKLGIGGQFVLANIEEKKAADQLGRVKKDLQYKLKVKQVIDRGILISKASKLGFALLIAYELKELDVIDVEHFRNTLEFLKNEFINGFILKNTAVVNQGEVIEVRHGVRANVGYVEAYIESLALQTAISSIPKEDPPYSLAYLSSIKEALIIRDPARTLVEYELIDIEKRVSRVYSECIDYRGKMILYKIIHEIYDKISSEEGRVQCTSIEYEEYENSCHSIEKRVLYAHAGLQKEVINVLVETSQNNIRLEYSRECRDKVKELVLKEPIA